jgi:integrase
MRLNLQRRHSERCAGGHPAYSRSYESDERRRACKQCFCPIYAGGTLSGVFRRKNTECNDWEEARIVADTWERTGSWNGELVPVAAAKLEQHQSEGAHPKITIQFATDAYLSNRAGREIKQSTYKKYKTFVKQLRDFADTKGYVMMEQLQQITDMDEFYARWKDGVRAKGKKLERLNGFFNFCVKRKWILENPAQHLEPPVGAGSAANKTPFTDAEIQAMYAASRKLGIVKWKSGAREGEWSGEEVVTFMMLEIYTGLRIGDAGSFDMDRLKGNECFLQMHKTDKPLFTWLPDELIHRLWELAEQRGARPFMTPGGSTRMETVADLWRRKLNKVWALCGKWEERPHPHRFRHTFVRILLQNGVSPADVAELIGDTEEMVRKHYARWVPERQERLTRILQQALTAKVAPPRLVSIAGKRGRP